MSAYTFRGIELPEHLKEGIDRYVRDGVPTGGFLESVIDNDLKEAVGRADETSMVAIPAIVGYLYNECPARCWGYPGAVNDWVEKHRLHRLDKTKSPHVR